MKKATNLVASFRHAMDGVWHVLVNERNAKVHACVAISVIALAIWLQLDVIRWALLLTAIGLVFTAEMLNTVVELIIDLTVQQVLPTAKTAKDVAAGAVLLMALVAAAVGFMVLGPPLLQRLTMLLSA